MTDEYKRKDDPHDPKRGRAPAHPLAVVVPVAKTRRTTRHGFSWDKVEKICLLIENGVPKKTACASLGIGRNAQYRWQELEDAGDPEFEGVTAAFEEACSKARAKVVCNIVRKSEHDWRAGAWWLERTDPEAFGNVTTMKLDRPVGELTDEELEEIAASAGFVKAPQSPAKR